MTANPNKRGVRPEGQASSIPGQRDRPCGRHVPPRRGAGGREPSLINFSKNYSWISLLLYYWLLIIVHPIHFVCLYCSYTKNRMKYLGILRTCTQNVPVLIILGHLQKCPESICPMSFFNFSNLSHVLSQTCLKICPRPDMSRTRPGRVLKMSLSWPFWDIYK